MAPLFQIESRKGPLLLFLAAFFWAMSNIFFSFATVQVPTPVAIFAVYFIQTILSLLLYNPCYAKFSRAKAILVLTMSFYLILTTAALGYASPPDSLAVASSQIFFTPILSRALLNTKFNVKVLLMSIFGCIVGILMLIHPGFIFSGVSLTDWNLIGLLFELIGIIGLSFLFCLQRVTHADEYELTFWSNATVSSAFLFSATMQINEILTIRSISLLSSCAFVMFIGTVLSFAGWKITEPFISAMVAQSNLVFTFLMSCIVGIETQVGIDKILGLVIIVGSVFSYLYITRYDDRRELKVGPVMAHLLGIQHRHHFEKFDDDNIFVNQEL